MLKLSEGSACRGRGMEEERSEFWDYAIYVLAIVFSCVAWVFWGPGHDLVAEQVKWTGAIANEWAAWYQQRLEGSAKLLAPAITIASGSYAIYKAYRFAEARLHFRLGDFLDREEKRLKAAREQLRLTIERPGPDRPFKEPVFLTPNLKRAVRELGWGTPFLPPQIGYVDYQVGQAIDQLEKQIKLSEERHAHLKKQLATAHLLKGGLLAAEASRRQEAGDDERATLTAALNQFTSALSVDRGDVEALEYASHVNVRLGQTEEAEILLERLLSMAPKDQQSLTRARALRYRAAISAREGKNGVAARNLKAALDALPILSGIDRVEEAEIHDSLAECQAALGATKLASQSRLTAASIRKEVEAAKAELESGFRGWMLGKYRKSGDGQSSTLH